MAELSHWWGSDLSLGPTNDLAVANGTLQGQQRVLRRLLTAQSSYIWQLLYGAGLPAYVGRPVSVRAVRGLVRAQILKEAAVAPDPTPVITVTMPTPGVMSVTVQYVDANTGSPSVLSFDVNQ